MEGAWSARVYRPLLCAQFLIFAVLSQSGLSPAFVDLAGASTAQAADPPAGTTSEDPSEHHGVAPNCRVEVKKLCQGIRPGGGRIKQCIADNENKLSPECRKAVQERLGKESSKRP